jgi:hypothetical protein
MRWHEWLFQPSVSPAATSSTGVPRWPATSHTGASLQHCTSIIIPRLARYWPSLPGSALVDSLGSHLGSKTSSFPPTGEVLAEPLGSSSSSTSPLVRHWPSLRDDCLRHLCRRRVRSETQHPGVPVGHSFIVHPASHRRGNGRALGRLPLYNIAAAGYGVRPNILVCQMAIALPPPCLHKRGWPVVLATLLGVACAC